MISSSVGSGHPGQCSHEIHHEIPHEIPYQGEGTCREKQFQLNVIISLIWDFTLNGDFSSPICYDFFRTVLFLEKLLLHPFSE